MPDNEADSGWTRIFAPAPALQGSGRRLQVRHETSYRYQVSAALGYSLAWLTPRELPRQHVLEHRLTVWPKPRFLHEARDGFGNTQHYFEIHKGHTELRIQSQAVVELKPAPDLDTLTEPWETARAAARDGDSSGSGGNVKLAPWDFIYPTALTPLHRDYTAYAQQVFKPGRALGEALLAFNAQLHKDFSYLPGSTAVDTPLAEVWESRAGVCQDFAHIGLSALRGIGLAAAYVSGYLLTHPREGEEKRIGADASHAWLAVWTGANGWVHLDPTNNLVAGDEHIVAAMGRDYGDTPPVKGVCFGGGQHQLSVAVTVTPLEAGAAPAQTQAQIHTVAPIQTITQTQSGEDSVDGH